MRVPAAIPTRPSEPHHLPRLHPESHHHAELPDPLKDRHHHRVQDADRNNHKENEHDDVEKPVVELDELLQKRFHLPPGKYLDRLLCQGRAQRGNSGCHLPRVAQEDGGLGDAVVEDEQVFGVGAENENHAVIHLRRPGAEDG